MRCITNLASKHFRISILQNSSQNKLFSSITFFFVVVVVVVVAVVVVVVFIPVVTLGFSLKQQNNKLKTNS